MKFSFHLGNLNLSLGLDRSSTPILQRSNSPIQSWLRGEDVDAANTTLVSPFQQSVWIYTVVSALAQTVSAIPFRISRGDRSGETLVTKGPVVDLFNRPHQYLNRFRFWEFIVTWYCLRGEVFLVALDKSGMVVPIRSGTRHSAFDIRHLLILPPDQFRHIVEGYELAGWRFHSAPLSGPLPTQNFTPAEVIHDFLPNPYLFWRGLSPLSVAMLAAQTDYASAQFMKGLMLNNADTGVIVRTDQQLSEEQREQIKAALDARKRSAGTADRPLLLWGGTEIVKPTLSSADLQFLEHRKFNRQEICAAFFRMPQSLVGFTEDANRAIHQSERLNFIENSITPFCARLEATVEPIVKSFGQDLVGWFDMDSLPILQQARRDRVDTGVKLFALGYPANAINKSLDLGLPHLNWGDKGYLPYTLLETGSGAEEAPSPDPNQQSSTPIERMQKALERLARPKPETQNSKLEAHKCSANTVYEAALKPRIKQKLRKLSGFFYSQRNRVLHNLENATKSLFHQVVVGGCSPPLPSDGRGLRAEPRGDGTGSSAEGANHASHLLFDPVEETKFLSQKLSPLLRSDLEHGFNKVSQELNAVVPADSAIQPDQITSFLAQRGTKFKQINETTLKELSSSVLEGLRNGEAFHQLAERVKSIFQDAADRRAGLIAGNETNSAINAGRFLGMKAASVERKGWQTADDEKVRPAHAQAEGDYAKGIAIDQPFIVGGEELMYPGDANGSIGNVINCRCYTFPIVGDR